MCEYITAPQHNLVPLPDNVSFEEAARFGYIGTAYAALRKARRRTRQNDLHQWPYRDARSRRDPDARSAAASPAFSAPPATANASPASKRWRPDRIESLAQDEGKSVADWARSFTGGHGVDAIIDCLGPGTSGTLLMNAIYALRRGGKAINIGGVGEKTVMDIHWMMDNQIEFIGSNWFTIEDGEALAAMAAAGTLDLSVFEHVRVPLADVNRALDGSQFRDGGFTNVVIVP